MDNRFDRQQRIPGWDQSPFAHGAVIVVGAGPAAEFCVWALLSMGVGRLLWMGALDTALSPLGRWLAEGSFSGACTIVPLGSVEYEVELECILNMEPALRGILILDGMPLSDRLYETLREQSLVALVGGPHYVGPLDEDQGRELGGSCDTPAAAMAVAALVADRLRAVINPLNGDGAPQSGPAGLEMQPSSGHPQRVVQIGCGGIGVYSALLVATMGHPLWILDDDTVDATNLNRQGLFCPDDVASSRPKAVAAVERLRSWYPNSQLHAEVAYLDKSNAGLVERLRPTCIISAVDNARTRLLIQAIGQRSGIPVVQGGTDVFAADCFTQYPDGPTLDEQCYGAMTRAATAPHGLRPGGCAADPSYVVPGMICAAMIVHRLVQLSAGYRGLPPLRWRRGGLPIEQKGVNDDFS